MPPVTSLGEARGVICAVRARADAKRIELAEPPEEPLPGNCCERGCDRCVFTVYYEAVDEWRREVEGKL